jgi:hypothetical protein
MRQASGLLVGAFPVVHCSFFILHLFHLCQLAAGWPPMKNEERTMDNEQPEMPRKTGSGSYRKEQQQLFRGYGIYPKP